MTGGGRYALAVALALLSLPGALFVAGVGLLVGGLRCDEGCSPSSSNWRDTRDAWQWDVVLVLALVGLGIAFLFFDLIVRRRRRAATGALLAWLLVAYANLAWWSGSSPMHFITQLAEWNDPEELVLGAIPLLLAIAAIGLVPPRSHHPKSSRHGLFTTREPP